MGISLSNDELHNMLSEVDLIRNGQMELSDYLQVKWSKFIKMCLCCC